MGGVALTTVRDRSIARQRMGKGVGRPHHLIVAFLLLATGCPGNDDGGNTARPCVGSTSLFGWGANDSSQLLGLPAAGETTPAQLTNLDDITAVAAGDRHVLVLKRNGTVWAWGNNDHGQLGDGTRMSRSSPVEVFGLRNIRQIAAGANHSLALSEAGVILTWGSNDAGQLGYGTPLLNSDKLTPTAVSGFPALAVVGGAAHTVALKSDLTVWAWGSSEQLGATAWAGAALVDFPVQVSGLSDVIDIAAGAEHSLALRTDGSVWVWGSNDQLQSFDLGPGPPHFTPPALVPVPVQALVGASTGGDAALAAGDAHSVVRMADGTLRAWGSNDFGQADPDIGDPVTFGSVSPPLVDVTEVWAGGDQTLATTTDGKVWAWGSDESAQLGDAASSSNQLVQVSGMGGLTDASVGTAYALALATGVPEATPTSLTFASQRVRRPGPSQAISLTNRGAGPLTFCEIATSGDFSQTNDCPAPTATEPPSSTCTVQVSFEPSSGGVKSGSLIVKDASGTGPTVTLMGTATAPRATFTPPSLDFGNQDLGASSAVRQVVLANTGDHPLEIARIVTTGEYSQTNNCPTSLPPDPNRFCVIDVVFEPLDVRQRPGALIVFDEVGTEHAMSLNGTGTGPETAVVPLSVDFGSVPVDVRSNVRSITLTNTGTATLVLGAVSIVGAHSGDFTIVVDACGGRSLNPTQSCVVDLMFKPAAPGLRQADIRFFSNAAAGPNLVTLAGSGS